jgi:hypothetical protein
MREEVVDWEDLVDDAMFGLFFYFDLTKRWARNFDAE